jgi:hypothetical protein
VEEWNIAAADGGWLDENINTIQKSRDTAMHDTKQYSKLHIDRLPFTQPHTIVTNTRITNIKIHFQYKMPMWLQEFIKYWQ